jgi:WD40 repeat protein
MVCNYLYCDSEAPVIIFDLTGENVTTVNSVVFSANGQTLASGSQDKTIKLWHPATGKLLRTLTGHIAGVWSVAFSPDGQILASAAWQK